MSTEHPSTPEAGAQPIRGGWFKVFLATLDGRLPRTLGDTLRRVAAYSERMRRVGKAPANGAFHPGWEKMAGIVGLRSTSQTRLHFAALQELQLVELLQQGKRGQRGGRGLANVWVVTALGKAYLQGNREALATVAGRFPKNEKPAEMRQPGRGIISLLKADTERREPSADGKASNAPTGAAPVPSGPGAPTAAVEATSVRVVSILELVTVRKARLGELGALRMHVRGPTHGSPTPKPISRPIELPDALKASVPPEPLGVEFFTRGHHNVAEWQRRVAEGRAKQLPDGAFVWLPQHRPTA